MPGLRRHVHVSGRPDAQAERLAHHDRQPGPRGLSQLRRRHRENLDASGGKGQRQSLPVPAGAAGRVERVPGGGQGRGDPLPADAQRQLHQGHGRRGQRRLGRQRQSVAQGSLAAGQLPPLLQRRPGQDQLLHATSNAPAGTGLRTLLHHRPDQRRAQPPVRGRVRVGVRRGGVAGRGGAGPARLLPHAEPQLPAGHPGRLLPGRRLPLALLHVGPPRARHHQQHPEAQQLNQSQAPHLRHGAEQHRVRPRELPARRGRPQPRLVQGRRGPLQLGGEPGELQGRGHGARPAAGAAPHVPQALHAHHQGHPRAGGAEELGPAEEVAPLHRSPGGGHLRLGHGEPEPEGIPLHRGASGGRQKASPLQALQQRDGGRAGGPGAGGLRRAGRGHRGQGAAVRAPLPAALLGARGQPAVLGVQDGAHAGPVGVPGGLPDAVRHRGGAAPGLLEGPRLPQPPRLRQGLPLPPGRGVVHQAAAGRGGEDGGLVPADGEGGGGLRPAGGDPGEDPQCGGQRPAPHVPEGAAVLPTLPAEHGSQRVPRAHLPRPGWLLGPPAALHRGRQHEVRGAPAAQGQRVEDHRDQGGAEGASADTKEAAARPGAAGEGALAGLGGPAAAGGPQAAAGRQARRLLPPELGHRERRQHRDLHPRGADPAVTPPRLFYADWTGREPVAHCDGGPRAPPRPAARSQLLRFLSRTSRATPGGRTPPRSCPGPLPPARMPLPAPPAPPPGPQRGARPRRAGGRRQAPAAPRAAAAPLCVYKYLLRNKAGRTRAQGCVLPGGTGPEQRASRGGGGTAPLPAARSTAPVHSSALPEPPPISFPPAPLSVPPSAA
ncbi:disks large-associated protein 3 isoform X3 [Dromaius novaehollandiae]|uniref:disks large-associated protein 3 isoform X3 n=1 Tax=Dromaius novaehollandiae TaxID=8790 RepID=UPI00311D7D06